MLLGSNRVLEKFAEIFSTLLRMSEWSVLTSASCNGLCKGSELVFNPLKTKRICFI
jgi:hypothetical protein